MLEPVAADGAGIGGLGVVAVCLLVLLDADDGDRRVVVVGRRRGVLGQRLLVLVVLFELLVLFELVVQLLGVVGLVVAFGVQLVH